MDSRQMDDTAGSEEPSSSALALRNNNNDSNLDNDNLLEGFFSRFEFLCLRDLVVNNQQSFEFECRFDNGWNFTFLDEAGTSLIGWESAEVLGNSGYDHYHDDELHTKIIPFHNALIENGENISPEYRFLTKSSQWLWVQTDSHTYYPQGTNKAEYVCINRIVTF